MLCEHEYRHFSLQPSVRSSAFLMRTPRITSETKMEMPHGSALLHAAEIALTTSSTIRRTDDRLGPDLQLVLKDA
jgi:hypothetical protein